MGEEGAILDKECCSTVSDASKWSSLTIDGVKKNHIAHLLVKIAELLSVQQAGGNFIVIIIHDGTFTMGTYIYTV